jgi:type II secretory pathway pseudopilin PulG
MPRSGRSLLEILIVVTVIAILGSLAVPLFGHFRRKAEDAACMGNLRTLHASFSSYLLDHKMIWPQLPGGIDGDGMAGENDVVAEFWFKTMEPYGSHRETWICPAERRTFAENTDSQIFDASYSPTLYDPLPNVAYQWATQPWLIERGGFHQGEANRVMPDGSIQKDFAPFPGQ